jgi:hypothetical protein
MIVSEKKRRPLHSGYNSRSFDSLLHESISVRTAEHRHAPLEFGSLRAGADFIGVQATEAKTETGSSTSTDDGGQQVVHRTSISGALVPTALSHLFHTFSGSDSITTNNHIHSNTNSTITNTNSEHSYNVYVQLQSVDLRQDYLCGYLTIEGLTELHPTLTTYFDGEIINGPTRRHSFATHKWGADEGIDAHHWQKFAPFKAEMFKREAVSIRGMDGAFGEGRDKPSRYVFMRWKELFLVPDHRIRTVAGASYDGFYYVMYDAEEDRIEGYYYHDSSEKNQHLQLWPAGRERSSSFDFS